MKAPFAQRSILACGLALLVGAGLAGCSQSQAARAAATGNAGGAAPKAGLVQVPPEQMGHVQVVAAQAANWPRLLRLSGSVDYDQFLTTPVITQVGGPVARLLAVPGQEVKAGQTLLEVSSPDYAAARNTYLKARDGLALATSVYNRDQDLYEHHAVAEADVQAAASARNQAQADLQAAEESLRILGLPSPDASTAESPTAVIPLKAPIGGEIVERDVAPGQLLQAGATQCFVISDMSTVWVLANVYQSDLDDVRVGDAVSIASDAFPQTLHGRIEYLSPALDPNTRTLQARIATPNPGGLLKRQMYVTATVEAGSLRGIVVVPDAAVLRDDQNVPFLYVRSGQSNQFEHRTVSIGASQNGYTQITAGLRPGEAVAGNGSLFLQFASSFQN